MDSVVHFEMPYEKRDRMTKFYQDAFGWQAQDLGPDMGNYVVVTTTESNETGRPRSPAPSTADSTRRRRTSRCSTRRS